MRELETKNARITKTFFGIEDHGILTVILHLEYNASGQGFGMYSLDGYNEKLKKRIGTAYGMEFIRRILEVLELEKWEDLKGQLIRVKATFTKVHEIGHIVKDKWFNPETDPYLEYIRNENSS